MKIIGLDVGTKRIGVAKADAKTRIAVPDGVILVNGQEFAEIARLGRLYDTNLFVIGLPRNSLGEETAQSTYVRNFAHRLARTITDCKIYFQDESLTSVEAEARLKSRKKHYQKGEIDAEAATIILQDFLEQIAQDGSIKKPQNSVTQSDQSSSTPTTSKNKPTTQESSMKSNHKPKPTSKTSRIKFIALFLSLFLAIGGFLAYLWYDSMLQPVETSESKTSVFDIKSGQSLSVIAENLESRGLIKNAFAFRIYAHLSKQSNQLKTGSYQLKATLPVSEILAQFVKGSDSGNTFRLTILPGETIAEIKHKMQKHGYSDAQLSQAFQKFYKHPVLEGLYDQNGALANTNQPITVQLEGYLYGDTYEFYKKASAESIIKRVLDEFWRKVQSQNLIADLKAQDLTLREGIILASIIQKEAKPADYAGVASVFLNRLRSGMSLGSDITASYAANLLDPERKTYQTNADVLTVDSLYNTRKNTGLPPGPIAVPSLAALKAVANPAEDSHRFFLTGDNGKMYYSYTDAEHQENIRKHCQKLCQSKL